MASAEAARAAIEAEEFALAVIDVGLPGADGLTLVRRLRSAGITMPTLMLTARCTLTDKVKALDIGADDFLSKPFEPAELAARCRALMRRAGGALEGYLKLNRMSVDLHRPAPEHRRCREWSSPRANGWCSNAWCGKTGQIVPKERVQQALAGPEQDITANAVEVHVSRLRAKFGDAAIIRSLRGLGYRLEEVKTA